MKTRVKSLVFASGLALVVLSLGTGSARAQSFSTFSSSSSSAGMNTGGFAGLAGFYQGYGARASSAPEAFSNPPLVSVPRPLTSYVPAYEGLMPFYGPKFTGGAYRPMAYYYQR
jgi:hypothetical protein